MFGANVRRIYYVCDKIIVRDMRSRHRLGIKPSGPNPGLDRRLEALKEDGVKVRNDNAEEFMQESESNFFNVDEAYHDHLKDSLIGKHMLRRHIVKDKYFKENMPNLLTWSEKEQIRHLVNTRPDEWSPEKIAESFPVTASVVKKLLKYPWKPASDQRIARHDESAMRNWRELKEGTLDVPEDLRQHFLKFSERTIPPLRKESIKVDLTQKENIGEFERIIQRCAAKENVEQNSGRDKEDKTHATNKSQSPVTKDYKRVTLDELASNIKNQINKGNNVNLPDAIIAKTVNATVSKPDNENLENSEIELFDSEKGKKEVTQYQEKDSKMLITTYPERIRIPKKAYKKGATYKVNDCYYDHDGKFLYRVIGMTN